MNQFEMKQLAYQSNLKNRALQVLLYLIDRANKEQTCFPAMPTIGRELHISISTVKRAMVCNALKVDIGILCSYYAQNIDSGYVSEIERLCAYRYNIPQVNFYISENKMKTDSENKLEIGIYRLGKNIIDSLNISNHNLQNVKSCFDNNNSLEELWYQVECKLAENVECIV